MHVLKLPQEVFRTVATAAPKPRPRHRDTWSLAELHHDKTQPVFCGRHLARPAGWTVIEVKR